VTVALFLGLGAGPRSARVARHLLFTERVNWRRFPRERGAPRPVADVDLLWRRCWSATVVAIASQAVSAVMTLSLGLGLAAARSCSSRPRRRGLRESDT
jgi:hypothetical protein